MEIIKEIKKLKCGKVVSHAKMCDYTTYKVGGKVIGVVYPISIEALITLIKFLKSKNIRYKILGNGSNVIFKNTYYDMIIIKLNYLNDLKISGKKIIVGSGYNLIALSLKAAKENLTGLEFASGIPGTVGGAIYMNAGAYKSDMGYIVKEVKVLDPNLNVIVLKNNELDFHYRTSFLKQHENYICLEATLELNYGKKEAIMEVIRDRKKRRLESQPLNYPSAGSVFRNPNSNYAGKLIEDLGFKGKSIGGAMVSVKHANFIINYNRATGEEIIELINTVKEKVKEEYGIELIVEQEIVE